MSRFLKVPSPATVIATVALFVSLGGTAWAVKQIGTNQIKNNAVTTKKIKNQAVTPGKSSMMWALIAADGSVVKSSGGVSVAEGSAAGNYYVKFPRSVKGRLILTSQRFSDLGGTENKAIISASACGAESAPAPPGQITCNQAGFNTVRDIYVSTFKNDGFGSLQSFYVMVW